MAFRRKAEVILAYKPDILIIPECEHPEKLLFINDSIKPTNCLWFGQNRNKGMAVFSYSNFKLNVLDVHDDCYKMIVPINVSYKRFRFILFAVWANNPLDKDGQYVTQVWKAIHRYDAFIKNKRTVLIGDFNSNTIWDKPRREGNHSALVKKLEEKSIFSLYHNYFNQVQGKEKHATFYLYKHKEKPYHLDYCFASKDMIKRLACVEIGDYDFWMKYSDHVPVIVTFDI